MGATAPSSKSWTRRRTIALAVSALGLGQGLVLGLGRAAANAAVFLLGSRKRLLNDTAHARPPLQAEI